MFKQFWNLSKLRIRYSGHSNVNLEILESFCGKTNWRLTTILLVVCSLLVYIAIIRIIDLWWNTRFELCAKFILPNFYTAICLIFLNIYFDGKLLMLIYIDKSINGDYLYKIFVKDLKNSNRDILNAEYTLLARIIRILTKRNIFAKKF